MKNPNAFRPFLIAAYLFIAAFLLFFQSTFPLSTMAVILPIGILFGIVVAASIYIVWQYQTPKTLERWAVLIGLALVAIELIWKPFNNMIGGIVMSVPVVYILTAGALVFVSWELIKHRM